MFQNILCPVDGSTASARAARAAYDLTRKYGGKLVLLHVVPVNLLDLLANRTSMAEVDLLPREVEKRLAREGEELLAEVLAHLDGTDRVETRQIEGVPGEIICGEAEAADMVVMGSRGRGRLQGLLMGSVSQYVATHCGKPILIVPETDPQQPTSD